MLHGCDALVHTAALHLLNGKGQPMAEFIRVNVQLTAALLDRAVAAGIRRFALCSSMTVQVGIDLTAGGMAVLDEDMPCRPDHAYSLSKVMVEELARTVARRHRVSTASLRFMGFGHDCTEAGTQLIARVLSARDAGRACLLAVERDGLRGEAFNVGSGTPLSNRDIADAQKDPEAVLERLFPGCAPVLLALAVEARTTDFWPACSNAKSKALLGYEPQDTFAAWLSSHGWRPATP
ncbi:MAG: putative Nucleoside-diphosphate-sugar epimerase [Verrucomicrobia bacterium]|nr:putative Nucleoside-diphosphate-sugar epimerase [Verrucomicrobiota bacterium]